MGLHSPHFGGVPLHLVPVLGPETPCQHCHAHSLPLSKSSFSKVLAWRVATPQQVFYSIKNCTQYYVPVLGPDHSRFWDQIVPDSGTRGLSYLVLIPGPDSASAFLCAFRPTVRGKAPDIRSVSGGGVCPV